MALPKRYHEVQRQDVTGFPPLCDQAPPQHSRICVAMQYCSWLLASGDVRRLVLLTEHRTCEDYKDACAEDAKLFRRADMVAATWTARRHSHYDGEPWQFASLPDTRLSRELRLVIVDSTSGPRACRGQFFVDPLLEAVGDEPEQMVTDSA